MQFQLPQHTMPNHATNNKQLVQNKSYDNLNSHSAVDKFKQKSSASIYLSNAVLDLTKCPC